MAEPSPLVAKTGEIHGTRRLAPNATAEQQRSAQVLGGGSDRNGTAVLVGVRAGAADRRRLGNREAEEA